MSMSNNAIVSCLNARACGHFNSCYVTDDVIILNGSVAFMVGENATPAIVMNRVAPQCHSAPRIDLHAVFAICTDFIVFKNSLPLFENIYPTDVAIMDDIVTQMRDSTLHSHASSRLASDVAIF